MKNKIIKLKSIMGSFLKNDSGQVMMISTIFFIAVSSIVVFGLTGPSAREFRNANNSLTSKQAYFFAESGVEDSYYRLKYGKVLGGTNSVVLGTSSVVTTVTALTGTQKEIVGLGSVGNIQRKVDIKTLFAGGLALPYVAQAGQGGLSVKSSSNVTGNVYSNGNITGDNSAYIHGNASAAVSPSLYIDQQNGSGTPAYDNNLAYDIGHSSMAQSFKVSSASPVVKVQLYMKSVGSPSGALTAYLIKNVTGAPSAYATSYIAKDTVTPTITSSYSWVDFTFTASEMLTPGVSYFFVLSNSTASALNYYVVGGSGDTYANGSALLGKLSGDSWYTLSTLGVPYGSASDYYFKIYMGGLASGYAQGNSLSSISPLSFGSGDIRAHQVNYTTTTGTIYCASGTGNNKSCTSSTDPNSQAFAFSDTQLDAIKAVTDTGTLTACTPICSFTGYDVVGSQILQGNVTVTGTLVLTGPVHIKNGNLTVTGGSIYLDSSYGTNSGALIVDGTITISGGGTISGSGIPGSTILVASTNYVAPGAGNAISVTGGDQSAIFFAPYSKILLNSSATAKQASAYAVELTNSSSITYDSNLASVSFPELVSPTAYSIASWVESL